MVKRWCKRELVFLRRYYSRMKNKEISKRLKRPMKGVMYIASKLGLKKDKEFYCEARRHLDFKITKNDLIRLYVKKKKSIRKVAKELRISKNTADYYLKKFKIKTRTRAEATKERFKWDMVWCKGLSKEKDERLKRSFKNLSKTCKKKREVRIRKIEVEFNKPFSEVLRYLYWDKKMTQEKIANRLKMDRGYIIDYMKKYKIKLRLNYEYISSLKGEKHPMYGRTWEEVYGINGAKERRKFHSRLSRKLIIKRLENNEFPFFNTKIEIDLAEEMKRRKISFVSQFNVDNKFVCDFAIPKLKVVIECDGDFFHTNPKIYDRSSPNLSHIQIEGIKRDRIKSRYLIQKGWIVLRFFESDIKRNVSKCVDKIEEYINKRGI